MQYAITALLFTLSCLAYAGGQNTSSYDSATTSNYVTRTNIVTVDNLDASGTIFLNEGDFYWESFDIDNTVTTEQTGMESGYSTTLSQGWTHGNIGHSESETSGYSEGTSRAVTTIDNSRTGEYVSIQSGSEFGIEYGEFDVTTTGTVTTRNNYETEYESESYSEYTTY